VRRVGWCKGEVVDEHTTEDRRRAPSDDVQLDIYD
jgi:hypothetical protein